MDARVPVAPLLEAFGLPATVTRPAPNDVPLTTSVMWLPPLDETRPFGPDIARRDPRHELAVPRTDVPTIPRGTVILAPETEGGAIKTWRVEDPVRPADVDMWYVAVVQTA